MPPEMAEKKVKRAHRTYTGNDIDELKLAVSRGAPNVSIRFFSPLGARLFFPPRAQWRPLKEAGGNRGTAERG